MDKKNIINNFSKYARLYDRYADVQKQTAFELLSRIKEDGFKKILEVGCGTGNYTLLLKDKFDRAEIKAVDICDKMVEVAREKLKSRGIEFLVADAETIALDEEFDLITSNASVQWFQDLEGTLTRYKNLLRKEGLISFSAFGPLTFCELNTSLKHIFKNISIPAAHFVAKEKIEKILEGNFRDIEIKEVRLQESFSSLMDLLNKIKYTGIRGEGFAGRASFGPQTLRRLEEAYLDKYKEIKSTYQVFFCRGLK